jgi:hypothetical protein
MALFGKSEKELQELQEKLDDRERKILEVKRNLEIKKADILNRDKLVESRQSDLAKKEASVGKRENDIFQRELEAKNNFVKQQREAFHEAIDSQMNQLDLRKGELDALEQRVAERLQSVIEREGRLADREQVIKERELSAEAGFASKKQTLIRELEKREDACKTLEQQLKQRDESFFSKLQEFKKQAEGLRQRETKIRESEIEFQAGFTEQKKALEEELFAKRIAFDEEIEKQRSSLFSDMEVKIAEERAKRQAELNKEITENRSRFEEDLKSRTLEFDEKMKRANDELQKAKNQVSEARKQLDADSGEFEIEKRLFESRRNQFTEREENIDDEVKERVAERHKSFESDTEILRRECERLRESIKTSEETMGQFEELKRKLDNQEPAEILLKLKIQEEALNKLRSDLAERPTEDMRRIIDEAQAEAQRLEDACNRLSEDNEILKKNAREQNQLEMQIEELTSMNKSLTRRFDSVEADNNRLNDELKRLRTAYEREQDREDRIGDIETPYVEKELPRSSEEVDEIDWLNRIDNACIEFGFRFPRRILYSFHTALKTAEWSPLTVLAGVSGTGKSELPRLYSHFGGMNFLNLSVQPNWDSQESMLGFFNSIDNKFDAQPILRLLAQSQKKWDNDYPGLEDVMSMILLDEMNLAHIELYFAEFLSKLEFRRGIKGNVPCLEVKLGAGIPPYDLPLGRNVLWTGTMNQDETTKSLSDKVLDRGITIYFPRPTTLERRSELKPLNGAAPLLPRRLWESWWLRDTKFTDEQILPYKAFIEDMNNSLAKAGRALGHRVWQSVEYYMANYPEVISAQKTNDAAALIKSMKIAFEDQLVQKIMPKLRGIETRGQSKSDCLDKIRSQLVNDDYAIVEDFDLACQFGYGQFMWHSANYLKDNGSDSKIDEVGSEKTIDIIEHLSSLGLDTEQAEKVASAGIQSIDDLIAAKVTDLADAGIDETEFLTIQKKVEDETEYAG